GDIGRGFRSSWCVWKNLQNLLKPVSLAHAPSPMPPKMLETTDFAFYILHFALSLFACSDGCVRD
ncbi:MAG: hypothetical protein ACLQLG_18915, partial [Thermoguttaceae bacterium]